MKFWLFLASVLFSYTANADCGYDEINSAVDLLGAVDDYQSNEAILLRLSECPIQASSVLIKSFKPVSVPRISTNSGELDKQALHVTWVYRGLRYLNKCIDFQATDPNVYKHSDKIRNKVLRNKGKNGKVPFMAVWMSRDVVYFAPYKSQIEIIQRWNFYVHHIPENELPGICNSIEDWYL